MQNLYWCTWLYYPVRVCAAGLCVWSRQFVYVYMYVCIYVNKKWAVWGLTTGKSPASVIYCSLVEFNGQKGAYYARWFVLGKKFGFFLLTGRKKGPGNLYYGKPCLVYMQCSYALLTNVECQHTTAAVQTYNITRCSLYWQCLECTGYMCSVEL